MNIDLPIPDDLARRLSAGGDDIARRALEAFAVEEFRVGRLSKPELRRLLGFETRAALDAFLKGRQVDPPFGGDDLAEDRRDLERLGF